MRQLAIAIATALVLAMISPAFAQPFADTPTNHWAYDAIAELAAKGLIEGYPDGTFKGDRAMTRYEMAMVVARLLARIESIQIPAPAAPAPRPEIGRADLDTILRLVNEFRAELAAKNVRLTAVEEELNAIKSRLDNVKIRGRFRVRYDTVNLTGSGASLNGNPNTGIIGANAPTKAAIYRAREGLKLLVDGSVTPDVHAILGLELAACDTSTPLRFDSGNVGLSTNSTSCAAPINTLQTIVELFFDWKNIYGTPLELWVGRFGTGVQGFGGYPVQFGPFGLLLSTNGNAWSASAGNSGFQSVDGLRLAANVPAWADMQAQFLVARVIGNTGASSFGNGEDVFGFDANFKVIEGLRVGGYYVWNNPSPITPTQSSNTFTCLAVACPAIALGSINGLWHTYGNPDTGSMNPQTPFCPTVLTGAPLVNLPSSGPGTIIAGGIECPSAGNGFGIYLGYDVIPGIHLDAEGAQWTQTTLVPNTSDSAYVVNLSWDLGSLLGIGHNTSLQTGYVFAGTNFFPPYGNALDTTVASINGNIFPGDFVGFEGVLSFDVFDNLTLLGQYINGNNVFDQRSLTEWQLGVIYKFAPGTSIWVFYENVTLAGISQQEEYRAEMNYTF